MIARKITCWILTAFGLISLVVVACEASPPLKRPVPPRVAEFDTSKSLPQSVGASDRPSQIERKIVRNADLSIVVDHLDETMDRITHLVETEKGFIVRADRSGQAESKQASVSFRVPSERLDATLAQLRQWATLVEHESIFTNDVTEEYIDTEARLKSLKAVEGQYLDLLKKAQTVEETLKVQQALTDVRIQIESTEGRMRFLEQTTTLSLVNVQISTSERAKPIMIGNWDVVGIATSAVRELVNTALFIASALIWIVIFTPIWVPLALLGRWIRRWRRRRREIKLAGAAGPATSASDK